MKTQRNPDGHQNAREQDDLRELQKSHIGPVSRGRLVSLDVFRGITIAGMILVNNAGSEHDVYWPLRHAQWHGWTPTDLVFPFFLFIVGISITLALSGRVEIGGSRADLMVKIAKRSLIIFLLGLIINGFPFFHLPVLRIPGVLQRIAVCYLLASMIFVFTRWKTQAALALALPVVYFLVMTLVAAPGFQAGDLTRPGSLASYVDRLFLAGHIYRKDYDPEGILSTIPAIATTLMGILTGHWLRSRQAELAKAAGMFVAGTAGLVVGWIWNAWFPINKALWTSSYVFFTAGLALLFFAVCYWLIEIQKYRRWAKPFMIFGANALALYVLSTIVGRMMGLWHIDRGNGAPGDLKTFLVDHLFASWLSPINASLFWAIAYVVFWLAVLSVFYRKNIFIKA
ncbi:MAG TPA: heparan-alpha-glucosaminide N-acetyltransferase domain-containing protein [Candidatus Dormibacteraeota bacterium]|nr:heparan-alpha-glucosaminide N-acetyltransferase domain-containing protein [Candidatus Dormibacteraeota bacterium]